MGVTEEAQGIRPLSGTLLFHLNLSYSSVEAEDRGALVRAVYRPLLSLLDEHAWLRIAVEASGHTLERIAELDPEWIQRLAEHVGCGRVELVGSGDTQLIGPLVPAAVNRWNQRLGRESYERLVGSAPGVALVNECAWSQGVIDAYLDAGYHTLLMEWNNPRRSHPEWEDEWRYARVRSESPRGRGISLLWIDAIAFQKFQRAVTGELETEDYLSWVRAQRGETPRHLFLYASDAETFGYRPGRYASEAPLPEHAESEWARVGELAALLHEEGVRLTLPSQALADPELPRGPTLRLSSAADPIPVKKQPKYNVTRWALSGRDDLGLNARCFGLARSLQEETDAGRWRELCRMWASDHRTHLTEKRWRRIQSAAQEPGEPGAAAVAEAGERLEGLRIHRTGDRLLVETGAVRLKLNLRRGLAIESLAFPRVLRRPLVGTLPHGTFDHIDWAADFYSGHTVVETSKLRATDLERVEPRVDPGERRVEIAADVPTALGVLPKSVRVFADRVELFVGLSSLGERPACSLRTGILTLLPGGLGPALALSCASGGETERFPLEGDVHHGASVSPLVSASAAFGATDGRLALDDGRSSLQLSWPLERAPALPLLTSQSIEGSRFCRVSFSLCEIDETFRDGAPLRDFELTIRAGRVAP